MVLDLKGTKKAPPIRERKSRNPKEKPECWRKHKVKVGDEIVKAGKLIAQGKSGFKCILCGYKYVSGKGWIKGKRR